MEEIDILQNTKAFYKKVLEELNNPKGDWHWVFLICHCMNWHVISYYDPENAAEGMEGMRYDIAFMEDLYA